jgi:hypothetical protein
MASSAAAPTIVATMDRSMASVTMPSAAGTPPNIRWR